MSKAMFFDVTHSNLAWTYPVYIRSKSSLTQGASVREWHRRIVIIFNHFAKRLIGICLLTYCLLTYCKMHSKRLTRYTDLSRHILSTADTPYQVHAFYLAARFPRRPEESIA